MAANRKFLFTNSDNNYEEEVLSVSSSGGAGDALKLATLDATGKWDVSFIPDSIKNDRDWKDSVRAGSTAALPAVTYANGTAGVGATLTADVNGALPAIDGITLIAGEEILIKDQAAPLQNGIYSVTAIGDAGNPFVLTRRTDADQDSEVTAGMAVPIAEGAANGDKYALLTGNDPLTVGTSSLPFSMQNTTNLAAGDGIDITSNVVSTDLVADGGLEINATQLQAKFADTSVAADLDGTNGLHAISSQDLSSNGASQGAKVLGFDPTACAVDLPSMAGKVLIQDAIDQLCSEVNSGGGISYTAGEALVAGDLVYVSAANEVSKQIISGVGKRKWPVGVALSAAASSASVFVAENDVLIAGAFAGFTAGGRVFWSGTALTQTAPSASGSRIIQVGVAKNATDLHVDIKPIKVNS